MSSLLTAGGQLVLAAGCCLLLLCKILQELKLDATNSYVQKWRGPEKREEREKAEGIGMEEETDFIEWVREKY